MSDIIVDPDEVKQLWTEIWHLKNPEKSEEYKGLSEAKRKSLLSLYYGILNYHVENASNQIAVDQLAEIPDDPNYDPEIHDPKLYPAPGAERRLWIPEAVQFPRGKSQGKYPQGYPEGVVWHWTAGHRDGLASGMEMMKESPYLYMLIDKDGKLAQPNPLNEWGYHAGASSWPGVSNTSVHNKLAGIEVQCAGDLRKKGTKLYADWGYTDISKQEIPTNEGIYCKARGNIQEGWYHMYTEAQCKALRRVTLWLYFNDPITFKIENVVGHDEVAPTRKCDPGGSYVVDGKSLTMAEIRTMLKEDVVIIKGRQVGNRA